MAGPDSPLHSAHYDGDGNRTHIGKKFNNAITCTWAEALSTGEGFRAILSREITHVTSKLPSENLKDKTNQTSQLMCSHNTKKGNLEHIHTYLPIWPYAVTVNSCCL